MQKIIPHLWFMNQAEEAVNFYLSIFKSSSILQTNYYDKDLAKVSGMLEDSVLTIDFELDNYRFIALNGGPIFHFTPAISFFVNCKTKQELDIIWGRLLDGGLVLMELEEYPFSKRFGWIQDKYGVNWQLNSSESGQKIIPFLMFSGNMYKKAEEAMTFYTNLFQNSCISSMECYEEGDDNIIGSVKQATFILNGQKFMAIDSVIEHSFTFTEAISFYVNCETQQEVDELWEQLSKSGEEQQCGWLKDKYGVSWQIVPTVLEKMMRNSDSKESHNVMMELLKMKKIEINKLQNALENR